MKPVVSVYCCTYNHEKYIKDALEGFVSQKTNFPFKIIVHDDASTDRTQEIIRSYAEQYPELIIPIFQRENQYSKHIKIYEKYVEPYIDTKYTAICEGDDYWCDENKLQNQYDYMEAHPSCSLCVHNTEMISENGYTMQRLFNPSNGEADYMAEEIISAGPGGLFHTSSFLYKSELRKNEPEAFKMKYVGDYPLAIYLSCNGYVHYMGKIMSRYRVGSINSWVKTSNHNKAQKLLHLEDMIESLNRMDIYTKCKFHEPFQKVVAETSFEKSVLDEGILVTLQKKEYRNIFMSFPLKHRIKLMARAIQSNM